MNNCSIYVHIPFCESKCIYCDFVSRVCNENIKEKYFNRLLEEIEIKSPLFQNVIIPSIYIGGGTPSCVNEKYIIQLIEKIKEKYKLSNDCEITIECNPNSVTKEKLLAYKNVGIKRISFGVQTLNNKVLKVLGRLHNKRDVVNAINKAKDIGINNISCDLLLGLPKLREFDYKKQIKTLYKLGVNHISAYMLIVEENTVLDNKVKTGEIVLPSEDKTVNIYNKIVSYLKKKGFFRYEISNFAKNGKECLHNQRYWTLDNYIGFGISAHSFYNGYRIENVSTFEDYEKFFEFKKEKISLKEQFEEYVMLGLRTSKGISIEYIKKQFKIDILNDKKEEIDFLLNNKLIEIINNNVVVKEDKYGLTNQIILKLI